MLVVAGLVVRNMAGRLSESDFNVVLRSRSHKPFHRPKYFLLNCPQQHFLLSLSHQRQHNHNNNTTPNPNDNPNPTTTYTEKDLLKCINHLKTSVKFDPTLPQSPGKSPKYPSKSLLHSLSSYLNKQGQPLTKSEAVNILEELESNKFILRSLKSASKSSPVKDKVNYRFNDKLLFSMSKTLELDKVSWFLLLRKHFNVLTRRDSPRS